MAGAEPKKSDLGVRTASALVMVAIAGTALWLGGSVWAVLVAMIATGVYYEWSQLVQRFEPGLGGRIVWMSAGFVYLAMAAFLLLFLRMGTYGIARALLLVTMVIAIDVGAYFAGRTFGGPKIAPSISPSKTWAGLFGGMAGAATVLCAYLYWFLCFDPAFGHCALRSLDMALPRALLGGAVFAVVAQAGDFFESWMKRRAGVKDSGTLIPGHGGLFDRVDGLLAVCFVLGAVLLLFHGHDLAQIGGQPR
ncbi:MAG: phosphatidate cytidylyltransferase [Proteobacteria bacterium]|nr:phosphatidate cytidylyltransferase [Pseudomonadota bacterium]MDE2412692.1 phosphatidate cytidylyltransferase [Sphingomonadales bacterium]